MDLGGLVAQVDADGIGLIAALSAMVTAGSSIFLAIVATKGLRSVKLAQADMVNRAQREARQCAIDRCREMADVLIPAHSSILSAFRKQGIVMYVKSPDAVAFGSEAERSAKTDADAWVATLDANLHKQCVQLLNAAETWSMHFTQALADADAADGPCATMFMGMVIQLYPLLVRLRASNSSGNFPNTIQLFQNWYGKRIDDRNRAVANALVDAARKLQMEGATYERLPDPIGTRGLM